MKIRLVEEYNPTTDRTIFRIEKFVKMFPFLPFGDWFFVDLDYDRKEIDKLWERAKTKGVIKTRKVIAEAVTP